MDSTERIERQHGHAGCAHHVPGEDCKFCSIRHLSVCAALDPTEWRALESLSSDAHFDERATLFDEGDEAVNVYNVTAGVVRLIRSLPDGRRQVTGFALPGDFLGLSLEKIWHFSAEAVTPVVACRFNRAQFFDFTDRKPHLLRRLHEFSTHELSLAQDHMVLLGRLTAEEKIGAFLMTMRKRWGRVEGHAVNLIQLPMGRQDIADYLGLTIETVSRTINQMQRDHHLVIVPDGVRLLDLDYYNALAPN